MREKMKEKGMQQLRCMKRAISFVLALLLVVNMVSITPMDAQAAEGDEKDLKVNFIVKGTELSEADSSIKISINGADSSNYPVTALGANKYEVTLANFVEPAEANSTEVTYSISSSKYKLPITGEDKKFSVTAADAANGEFAVTTEENFDSIENQVTSVTVNGKINCRADSSVSITANYTDGDLEVIPAEDITVKNEDKTYSVKSKINRSIAIVMKAEGYHDYTQTNYVYAEDITNEAITLSELTYTVSGNIIDGSKVEIGEETHTEVGAFSQTISYFAPFSYQISATDSLHKIVNVKVNSEDAAATANLKYNESGVNITYEVASTLEFGTTSKNPTDEWTDSEAVTLEGTVSGYDEGADYSTVSIECFNSKNESKGTVNCEKDGKFSFASIKDESNEEYWFRATDSVTALSVDSNKTSVKIDRTEPKNVKAEASNSSASDVQTYVDSEGNAYIKDGANITVSSDENGSGVKGLKKGIATDNLSDWQVFVIENGSSNSFKLEKATTKNKYYVQLKDGVEKESSVTAVTVDGKEAVVDNAAPTNDVDPKLKEYYASKGSYDYKETKYAENQIAFVNPFKDDLSGMKSDSYSVWLGDVNIMVGKEVDANNQIVIKTDKFTETKTYKLTVKATDNLNNEAKKEIEVKIDNTKPVVTYTIEKTVKDKILNFLTFGNYANTDVKVTLKVTDNGTGDSGIDMEHVSLSFIENSDSKNATEITGKKNGENSKEYLVKLADFKGKEGTLEATATDNVGNEIKQIPTPDNTNEASMKEFKNSFLLESTSPDVPTANKALSADRNGFKDNGINWYDENTTVAFDYSGVSDANTATDKSSGLYSVEVGLNTDPKSDTYTDVTDKIKSLVGSTWSTIDSEDIDRDSHDYKFALTEAIVKAIDSNISNTGYCAIEFKVTDNAGNVTKDVNKFYFDITAPTIKLDSFVTESGKDITLQTYGAYTNEEVYATVSVADEGSSCGIAESSIKMLNDGEVVDITPEKVSEGVYKFTIPVNTFKKEAKLSFTVSDNLAGLNTLGKGEIDTHVVTKLLKELDNKFNAESLFLSENKKADIVSTITDPKYIDASKNNWYDASDVNVKYVVDDKISDASGTSGIQSVKFFVQGDKDTDYVDVTDIFVKSADDFVASKISSKTYDFVLNHDILKNMAGLNAENTGRQYKIKLEIIDNAGTSTVAENELFFDVTNPTFEVKYTPSGNVFEKLLKKFGFITNDSVNIEITTTDNEAFDAKAENDDLVKFIKLDSDINKFNITKTSAKLSNDNKTLTATYTLACPSIDTKNLYAIEAVVKDNVGNRSDLTNLMGPNNEKDIAFLLEKNAPVITAEQEIGGENIVNRTNSDEPWVSGDTTVDFTYTITDAEAGIYDIEANINGKDYTIDELNKYLVGTAPTYGNYIKEDTENRAQDTYTYKFKLDKSLLGNNTLLDSDGRFKIDFKVTDNAGNENTLSAVADSSMTTIGFDKDAPSIIWDNEESSLTDHNAKDLDVANKVWLDKDAKATYQYTIEDKQSGINFATLAAKVGSSDANVFVKKVTYKDGTSVETNSPEGIKTVENKIITAVVCVITVTSEQADKDGNAEVQITVSDKVKNENTYTASEDKKENANTWYDTTNPTFTYEIDKVALANTYEISKYVGSYNNVDMILKVTANDKQSGFDAGNKCIKAYYGGTELQVNGENYSKDPTVGNATCEFIIPVDNDQKLDKELTFTVNDRVFNTIENQLAEQDTQEGETPKYMAETVGTTITQLGEKRNFAGENSVHYSDEDSDAVARRVWCNAKTTATYQFKLEDVNSGIQNVDIFINDTKQSLKPISISYSYNDGKDPIVVENPGDFIENLEGAKIVEAVYAVPVKIADADARTGEASISFKVKDNAGNESTSNATDDGYEIYFDDAAPIIPTDSFQFSTGTILDDSVVHVYNTEKSGVEFGFFATTETTVSFNVHDYARNCENAGEGVKIKQVQYRLDSLYGEDQKANIQFDTKTGNCSFVVPQNFKGTVYVSASDFVDNQSGEKYPNGIIIEDTNVHNSASGASISLPSTGYHDAQGLPLYTGDVAVSIQGYDTHSGIRNATYTSQAFYGALNKYDTTYINSWSQDGSYGRTTGADNIGLSEVFENKTNLISNVSAVKTVTDNQNNISVNFNLEDRTGYKVMAEEKKFSIDTTAPTIDIQWDNNDVQNEKYYKAERTATVTVTERNFNPDACNFVTTGATPAISGWSHVSGGSCNGTVHTDDCKYVATITFSADSDYTFTFNTTDLAGHRIDFGQTFDFVIDKTAPVINVSYDNNSSMNGYYYKAARVGTISITEHNFRGSDVQTTITSNTSVPGVNGWSSGNDINTATVSYATDGDYTFNVAYTDLAGNPATAYSGDRFIIDLTKPTLEIYDIVDKSANNDVVAPGVRYADTNVDINGVAIALKGANNGTYSLDSASKTQSGQGVDLKMSDFPREKKVDDLYTMTATVSDLAGNQVEQKVMFSVNRFGSVYTLSKDTKELVDNKYTNEEQKVVVIETNVDTLEEKSVSVSRDGELAKLSEKKDYNVGASGDDASWKQYTYTLDKDNFVEEGTYNVSFSSKDRATNSQDNKVKDTPVSFVIDKTAPTVVISGVENNKQYRSNSRNVNVNTDDNIALGSASVTLNDEEKQYDSKELDSNDGVISLEVGSLNSWQTMNVKVTDAAGNTTESNAYRFLITTNLLIQYVSNKPILFSSIGGVVAIVGVAMFLVSKKRKGENETQQPPTSGAAGL